jgi:hypothetical protein
MWKLLKFKILFFNFLLAFTFLNNGVNLEEISLGGLNHNPAKYGDYQDFFLESNYSTYPLSVTQFFLFLGRKSKFINYGIEILSFNYGDIENRDNLPAGDFLGYYHPQDFIFSFLLSKKIKNGLKIGFSPKFYYASLFTYYDYTIGFDFGFDYRPIKFLTLNTSFTNLSLPLHYLRQNFYPPNNFNFGWQLSFIKFLNNYFEITRNLREKENYFKIGIELVPNAFFKIRSGYNFDNQIFNIGFSLAKDFLKFSYNYQIIKNFSPAHHFGLTVGK